MFKIVRGESKKLAPYRGVIADNLYNELTHLGRDLRGLRILHVNSNSKRGGVAEILHSQIPLLNGMGLSASWQTFDVPDDIYAITKYIHNGLQGSNRQLSKSRWARYESFNKKLARHINPIKYDVILIHDHQPASLLSYLNDKGGALWLWRCHVDSSMPNTVYKKRFENYTRNYDGAIFHSKDYVFGVQDKTRVLISPVAIDPLSPKNHKMSLREARQTIRSYGVDANKPIITQVCRFDPWKDVPETISAWKLAKKTIPSLQLVIAGSVSEKDEQGQKILKEVKQLVAGESDSYLFVNAVNGRIAKAFFTASNIVVQKSRREGFGLNVSEALWSSTPVIGGNAGGIKLQIKDGYNGYLVNNTQELAQRTIDLLNNKDVATKMGKAGHSRVKENFLLPRMIRDELRFIRKLL